MPSRKRNQGRARKAKAASAPHRHQQPRHQLQRTGQGNSQCLHGSPPHLPRGHAVCQFIDTFNESWGLGSVGYKMGKIVVEAIDKTYKKCPEVWRNNDDREIAIAHLVSNGANMLLNNWNDAGKDIAGAVAVAIHSLEIYDPEEDIGIWCVGPEKERLNVIDVLEGCERSLLKFYSKRLPCTCLDAMYADVRSKSKTGLCFHCKQRKDRSKLLVCAHCKNQQYCSQECQLASWPHHKDICKMDVKAKPHVVM